MEQNKEHVMTAREIADEIEKLIEAEKAESTDESRDVKDLEDALALIEKFAADEDDEETNDAIPESSNVVKPVVDTGVVAGPLNGLKSFLIKKQQDNEKPA